ncbi:MAG TPA: LysR family transcriptional regulator [Woeseiaceae bacterium]|nr:LysR family transcriptional regulator [Woeseiaceae bacterium]
MNLAAVDLKLLVVFDAVMSEGSVTRAGTRLGMTQPAVSNALGRLRHLLKDELFVRARGSMRPTPRALELTGPVRHALRQIEAVLDPSDFDPARDARVFKLAMSDHAAVTILPPLVKRLETIAPNVDLQVRPKFNRTVADLLDGHEIDFALGVMPDAPVRFSRITLFEDVYMCAMRRGHVLARGKLTLHSLAAAKHLAVRPAGEATNLIDHVLESKGLERRMALTVDQFLVIPAIIGNTDLVATLFRRTAEQLGILESPHLVLRPLPLPPVQATLLWHPTMTHHKAHRWIREVVVDSCRAL